MKDGFRNGYGTQWYLDGSIYKGSWSNNEKEGDGKMSYDDGYTYKGIWRKGEKHGSGILTCPFKTK